MSKSKRQTDPTHESPGGHYETRDVDFKRIIITGIGLLALMGLGLLYSWVVATVFSDSTPWPGAPAEVFVSPRPEDLPPLPRLQADPHAVLIQLRSREDSVLYHYGWVDRDSGLVQIPIERAMELVIRKGMLQSRHIESEGP